MTTFPNKAGPAVLNGSAAHDALPNLLHWVGMLEAATTNTCSKPMKLNWSWQMVAKTPQNNTNSGAQSDTQNTNCWDQSLCQRTFRIAVPATEVPYATGHEPIQNINIYIYTIASLDTRSQTADHLDCSSPKFLQWSPWDRCSRSAVAHHWGPQESARGLEGMFQPQFHGDSWDMSTLYIYTKSGFGFT